LNKKQITKSIKKISSNLGFQLVGVSNPYLFYNKPTNLDQWIKDGKHASMEWINNRKEERKNIYSYFPEVKSVISLGYNYFSKYENDNSYKISNYAWGEDYHIILKNKLYSIIEHIKDFNEDTKFRVCVDTSPIMEKQWAKRAGLGWIGKHTNLINPKIGSWFFLGEILLDMELDYDAQFEEDLCGTCTKCIDACPTQALEEYVLDSNKCISYLTIEHRNEISKDLSNNLSDWIYGCDVCQEVCPWNIKFQETTTDKKFHVKAEIKSMDKNQWNDLNEKKYKKIFKKSAVKRAKFSGIKRNIDLNKK
tara:strand:- start:39 stop:959 length:921 start_codon:yes stop_codon:yes gene_type:complete